MIYRLYLREVGSVLPKINENKRAKKSRLIEKQIFSERYQEIKYSHV